MYIKLGFRHFRFEKNSVMLIVLCLGENALSVLCTLV